LFVNSGRVRSRGSARAEPSAAAHDEHLVVEHGGKYSEDRKFLPGRDRCTSGKRSADLVTHLAVSKQIKLDRPVVEERLDLSGHVGEVHRGPDDDGIRRYRSLLVTSPTRLRPTVVPDTAFAPSATPCAIFSVLPVAEWYVTNTMTGGSAASAVLPWDARSTAAVARTPNPPSSSRLRIIPPSVGEHCPDPTSR